MKLLNVPRSLMTDGGMSQKRGGRGKFYLNNFSHRRRRAANGGGGWNPGGAFSLCRARRAGKNAPANERNYSTAASHCAKPV
jgi:hypothetical protein